jgi:hypothetical protein
MAVKPVTVEVSSASLFSASWLGLADADTGAPIMVMGRSNAVVQWIGTLSGSTPALEGSNDGTTWVALVGAEIGSTMRSFPILPAYVRPILSGGTAADVDFILVAKK